MVKISSILPSTARVASTDMSDAHPIRPGVPSFGRPMGRSAGADFRASSQLSMKDIRTQKEYEHSKIVNDITNDFFMNKTRKVEAPIDNMIAMDDYGSDVYLDESYDGEQPEYIRSGQYLDVSA